MQKTKNVENITIAWVLTICSVLIAFLSKFKPLLVGWIKGGKFIGTVVSMFVSIWTYSWVYPWEFAFCLILLLLVHELGHIGAAKLKKISVTAPAFIPFLGAFVILKKKDLSLEENAFVSFGGPFIGFIGGVCGFLLGVWIGANWLISASNLFLIINLLNCLPIGFLDGQKIFKLIVSSYRIVNIVLTSILAVVGIGYGFYSKDWAIFMLSGVLLGEAWFLWSNMFIYRKIEIQKSYFLENNVNVPGKKEHIFFDVPHSEDGLKFLPVSFPGLGVIGHFDCQGYTIERLKLIKTIERVRGVLVLRIRGQVKGEESSTVVPLKTRFTYGAMYLGLIIAHIIFLCCVIHPR